LYQHTNNNDKNFEASPAAYFPIRFFRDLIQIESHQSFIQLVRKTVSENSPTSIDSSCMCEARFTLMFNRLRNFILLLLLSLN